MLAILRCSLALFVLTRIFCSASARADEGEEVIARILADWKAKQEQLESVHVDLSGTKLFPKGCADDSIREENPELLRKLGRFPAEDTTHPLAVKLLLQLNRNWARKEMAYRIINVSEGRFQAKFTTNLFDGHEFLVSERPVTNIDLQHPPESTPTEVTRQTVHQANRFWTHADHPIMWGCGSPVMGGVNIHQLKSELNPRRFVFKGYGEAQGRRCAVLRMLSPAESADVRYELWVDLERGSSILRGQFLIDGKVSVQNDCEWERASGMWFPKRYRTTAYWTVPAERLANLHEMQVDRVVFNPVVKLDDFTIKLRPGMAYEDVNTNLVGIIGSDGKTVVPYSARHAVKWGIIARRALSWIGAVAIVVVLAWNVRKRWLKWAAR